MLVWVQISSHKCVHLHIQAVCERTVGCVTQWWALMEREADESQNSLSLTVYIKASPRRCSTHVQRLITNIHKLSCNCVLILQRVCTQHTGPSSTTNTRSQNSTDAHTHNLLSVGTVDKVLSLSSCSVWQHRRAETMEEIWKAAVSEKWEKEREEGGGGGEEKRADFSIKCLRGLMIMRWHLPPVSPHWKHLSVQLPPHSSQHDREETFYMIRLQKIFNTSCSGGSTLLLLEMRKCWCHFKNSYQRINHWIGKMISYHRSDVVDVEDVLCLKLEIDFSRVAKM